MDDKTAAKWNEMVNKFAMQSLIKRKILGFAVLPQMEDEESKVSYYAVTDGICALVVCATDLVIDLGKGTYMEALPGLMSIKPEDSRARPSQIYYTDYFDNRENSLLAGEDNKYALTVDREYLDRIEKTGRIVSYHASSPTSRILVLDMGTAQPCALIMPTRLGAFPFDGYDALGAAFTNMKVRENRGG